MALHTRGPEEGCEGRSHRTRTAKQADWHIAIKPGTDGAFLLIKKRGEFLGFVEAPDEKGAEAAGVRAFNLKEGQRKRLLVREAGLDADE